MGSVHDFPHRPNAPLNIERAMKVSGRSQRTIERWLSEGLDSEPDPDGKPIIRLGDLEDFMDRRAA